MNTETIAAIATAAGSGGIGVVRISGPKARAIGETITRCTLSPRHALFSDFKNADNNVIDQGIAIYFNLLYMHIDVYQSIQISENCKANQ